MRERLDFMVGYDDIDMNSPDLCVRFHDVERSGRMVSSVQQPLVTVIVPAFNAGEHLEQCAKSILAQSYSPIELIVVDDGSSDSTSEICDRLVAEHDNVCAIHQSNQGVASARNAGLDAARGEYVMFVDSDDWLNPLSLETGVAIARSDDVSLVILGHRKFNGSDVKDVCVKTTQIVDSSDAQSLMELDSQSQLYSCWGKIFKRTNIGNLRFNVNQKWGEDTVFVYNYLKKVDRIVALNQCLYNYLVRVDGANLKYSFDKDVDLRLLDEAYLDYYRDTDIDMKIVYTRMANHLIMILRSSQNHGFPIKQRLVFISKLTRSPFRDYYLKGLRASWATRTEKILYALNIKALWFFWLNK